MDIREQMKLDQMATRARKTGRVILGTVLASPILAGVASYHGMRQALLHIETELVSVRQIALDTQRANMDLHARVSVLEARR